MKRVTDELLAKRADALKNMQDISNEAAGGVLSGEQMTKFKAAQADFDFHDEQMKALEKLDKAEAAANQMDVVNDGKDADKKGFVNFIRTGDKSAIKIDNAMSTGTGSASALVPNDLYNTIITAMYGESAMLNLADVMSLDALTDIPVSGEEPVAYWTPENNPYTASDPTFGKLTLGANKLTALVRVSEELLQDSKFDIESYIAERTGIAFSRGEENAYINNTVAGAPIGFMASASVGATAADATNHTFTYGEIVDLFTSVKSPYRRQGSFLVSDLALKNIMLLQDGAGQFIFQPSYSEGMPDKLLAKPCLTSEYMPDTMATGIKPVAFGAFKNYKIAIRTGISMQRLVERYSDYGQVGFKFYMRADGLLAVEEAIKVMVLS